MEVKLKNYEIVARGKVLEARIYPPCKRNIEISRRNYFLQFPPIIAVKLTLGCQPTNYFDMCYPKQVYRKNPCCILAFNFVHEGRVYGVPLPQVNYIANGLGVCLVGNFGHGYCRADTTLDELLTCFWGTGFAYGGTRIDYFTSYHTWERMDLQTVLSRLKDPNGTLKQHLQKLRNAASKLNKHLKKKPKEEIGW